MRSEYLSNDRIESDEPQLYKHWCSKCGALYVNYLDKEENEICEVCADEMVG